jgi:hypothetical protein
MIPAEFDVWSCSLRTCLNGFPFRTKSLANEFSKQPSQITSLRPFLLREDNENHIPLEILWWNARRLLSYVGGLRL